MNETIFKVETVLKVEDWDGRDGPMKTYRLAVNGGQEVDLIQQAKTAAPTQGQEIVGHLEDGKYRPRIKKAKGGGGGSGGGSYADKYTPEHELDPVKIARITRSHSQEMAVRFLALGSFGDKDADAVGGILADVLLPLIDWFQADVLGAGQAAMEGGGNGAPEASRSSAPAPSQNGQTHERIAVLLEAAGVNDVAARTISDHVLGEMTASEQDAVIETLESENRRGAAVKRLTALTEEKNGEPLPRPSADESIPF